MRPSYRISHERYEARGGTAPWGTCRAASGAPAAAGSPRAAQALSPPPGGRGQGEGTFRRATPRSAARAHEYALTPALSRRERVCAGNAARIHDRSPHPVPPRAMASIAPTSLHSRRGEPQTGGVRPGPEGVHQRYRPFRLPAGGGAGALSPSGHHLPFPPPGGRGKGSLSPWERAGVREECPLSPWEREGVRDPCETCSCTRRHISSKTAIVFLSTAVFHIRNTVMPCLRSSASLAVSVRCCAGWSCWPPSSSIPRRAWWQ